MIVATEALKKILEKCNILLEDELISKELLLRTYADYFLKTIDKEKHNVGIVLHTGSICFDAISIIYALASCMVYNESDAEEIIDSLNVGDRVLYGKKQRSRYVFDGVIDHPSIPNMKCAKLSQGEQNTTYVPQTMWRFIFPDMGTSLRFDGRGIRKRSGIREDFYKSVFEYNEADIPPIVDVSVAIVMPRDRAEFLMENIKLKFDDKEVKPLELITASYFTENDEYRFGGNAGKNEANIKFSSKVSVARDLILEKNGNKHIGAIISGNETIYRGQTEIPELLNRRSLQFVYVCMNIDADNVMKIIGEVETPNVFACSKEFLLSYSLPAEREGKYCAQLSKQVDAVVDRDIEPHILMGKFTWDDYKAVKKAILNLKNSEYSSEEKDDFIIQSYSLINLFLTSVFKVSLLEKCIKDGKLEIVSPQKKMKDLFGVMTKFPQSLQSHAKTILDFLEIAYLFLEESSLKELYLQELLYQNSNKKIAIVVPKAYYAILLRECGFYDLMDDESLLTVVTANRFDNTNLYDHIIVVGNFNGKRFDTFRCRAAQRIETLLYDFESYFFKYKLRAAKKAESVLNSLSYTQDFYDSYFEDENITEITDNEIMEISAIDSEVDEYINRLNEVATFKNIGVALATGGAATTEVIAVGNFDSGEKVLFTKNYKAYVFDDDNGTVSETKVPDLTEGDSLVFTQRNSDTRDIVDSILSKLVSEEKVSPEIIECYKKSKAWKQQLVDYMQTSALSANRIASKMIANGVQVQEITIKGWLDEDSHTVGPRKMDSIQQIALLVENEEMFENAQIYFDACSTIRKVRREILKQIGEAIINKLCGKAPQENTIIADIYDRIDSIALILRLESITYIEREVPMNLTNRPISL